MSNTKRDTLNKMYAPLTARTDELTVELKKQFVNRNVSKGFFNGHFHKDDAGEYRADYYPIPVISVIDLCDIELDFDETSVTSKLSKEQLLSLNINDMCDFYYEVYGISDYLSDYGNRNDVQAMRNALSLCQERSAFITFTLPHELKKEALISFIRLLENQQFFY